MLCLQALCVSCQHQLHTLARLLHICWGLSKWWMLSSPPHQGVYLYVLCALPADSVGPFEVVDVVTATMEYLTSWKELQQEVKLQQPSLRRRRLAASKSDQAALGYLLDRWAWRCLITHPAAAWQDV